jgi:hypothetical protein
VTWCSPRRARARSGADRQHANDPDLYATATMESNSRDVDRAPQVLGGGASVGSSGHILIRAVVRLPESREIQSTLRYPPLRTHGSGRPRAEFMDLTKMPIQ